MTRCITISVLAFFGLSGLVWGQAVIEPLRGFEPFLDRTWVAVVDPANGARDVSRWEPILGGQAIRITHSVSDGAYGGETIVVWDRASERILFFYFTNAGFWTRGEFHFDEQGVLISREDVAGHGEGIEAVEGRQEMLPEGHLRVLTRILRNGVWENRNTVIYQQDPEATLELPDRLSPSTQSALETECDPQGVDEDCPTAGSADSPEVPQ